MPGLLSAAVASALIRQSTVPTSNTATTNISVSCYGTTSTLTQNVSLSYWSESDTTDYENNIPSVVGGALVSYKAGCVGYINMYTLEQLIKYDIMLPGTVYAQTQARGSIARMHSYTYGNAIVVTTDQSNLYFYINDYMFYKHMSNSFSVKMPQADDSGTDTFTASFGYQQDELTPRRDGRFSMYYRLAVDGASAGTPYIVALIWVLPDDTYFYTSQQIQPSMVKTRYTPGEGLSITGINLSISNTSTSAKTYGVVAVLVTNTSPGGGAWKNPNNVLMGILFQRLPKYTLQPNSSVTIVRNLSITPSGVQFA